MERTRELSDTIKDLCGKVLVAEDQEVEQLMLELRNALREHSVETRKLLGKSYSGLAGTSKK